MNNRIKELKDNFVVVELLDFEDDEAKDVLESYGGQLDYDVWSISKENIQDVKEEIDDWENRIAFYSSYDDGRYGEKLTEKEVFKSYLKDHSKREEITMNRRIKEADEPVEGLWNFPSAEKNFKEFCDKLQDFCDTYAKGMGLVVDGRSIDGYGADIHISQWVDEYGQLGGYESWLDSDDLSEWEELYKKTFEKEDLNESLFSAKNINDSIEKIAKKLANRVWCHITPSGINAAMLSKKNNEYIIEYLSNDKDYETLENYIMKHYYKDGRWLDEIDKNFEKNSQIIHISPNEYCLRIWVRVIELLKEEYDIQFNKKTKKTSKEELLRQKYNLYESILNEARFGEEDKDIIHNVDELVETLKKTGKFFTVEKEMDKGHVTAEVRGHDELTFDIKIRSDSHKYMMKIFSYGEDIDQFHGATKSELIADIEEALSTLYSEKE